MAFDPKRPHGVVHGMGVAHKFEQDGKFYDADGNEVVAASKKAPPKKGSDGAAAKVDEQSEVDKQLAAQSA